VRTDRAQHRAGAPCAAPRASSSRPTRRACPSSMRLVGPSIVPTQRASGTRRAARAKFQICPISAKLSSAGTRWPAALFEPVESLTTNAPPTHARPRGACPLAIVPCVATRSAVNDRVAKAICLAMNSLHAGDRASLHEHVAWLELAVRESPPSSCSFRVSALHGA